MSDQIPTSAERITYLEDQLSRARATISSLAAPHCSADGCAHCDTFGGVKTYANQACLPINGKVVCIDWCIHQLVAALNAGGIKTRACCCGHGRTSGRIDLEDGRVLHIENPRNNDSATPVA